MDMREMTPTQLTRLAQDAQAELLRRQSEVAMLRELDAVVKRHRASGVRRAPEPGAPWEPEILYGLEDVTTHKDRLWTSLQSPNPWEPGVAGWRAQRKDGKPAAYVQPSGAADAYRRGEQVTEDGEEFESRIDGNVWPPSVYPEGWKCLEGDDGEEDPVEPLPPEDPVPVPDPETGGSGSEDPDAPVEPAPPAGEKPLIEMPWAPDYVFETHKFDYIVTYEGVRYRVELPHTSGMHWLPPQSPTVYKVVESDA